MALTHLSIVSCETLVGACTADALKKPRAQWIAVHALKAGVRAENCDCPHTQPGSLLPRAPRAVTSCIQGIPAPWMLNQATADCNPFG